MSSKSKSSTNKPLNVCDECGMAFKKLEHLQRHMRTHTHDRPYACTFPTCGKAFARQDTLNRHAKLHLRDEAEGTKGRSRRRTKSISDSSISQCRRNSTSPYNTAQNLRRPSDVSASGGRPTFISGFAYTGPTNEPIHLPSLSTSVPPSSRFSTLELLGLSYPTDTNTSPASAYSPLPTLAELYPPGTPGLMSNGAPYDRSPINAFSTFSPLSHSLFLPSPPMGQHPVSLPEFDTTGSAPSPFFSGSDDGSSNASDPSSFGPSSFTSSLGTSVDSQPQQPTDKRSTGFDFNSLLRPLNMGNGQQQDDNEKLASLFQAADLPPNYFSWPLPAPQAVKPSALTQPIRSVPTNSVYMQSSHQQKFYSWLNAQGAVANPPAFTTTPSYPCNNPTPLRPEEQSFDWWAPQSDPSRAMQQPILPKPNNMASSLPSFNHLGLDFDAFIAETPLA